MSAEQLVHRFYDDVWNRNDKAAAFEILHTDLRFRGSLGIDYRGPEGFLVYKSAITAALSGFLCRVEDLVATPDRAVVQVHFEGHHSGKMYDVEPTGRLIGWTGAAFFSTDGGQITRLWILGDVDSVKSQLGAKQGAKF